MKNKALETAQNHNMFDKAERIIVGLSGGADSVALLHFLISQRERFGYEVCAAHVNHMLRGDESERDEIFVRSLCDGLGVPLNVLRTDVNAEAKKRGVGQEECGRQIRYEFFRSLCTDNCLIATAHTLSDSLETIILNIARGTGLHGLCGISAVRGNIIRPLIECTRSEIEQYCRDNDLSFVNDSSNDTRDYNRNIVRLDVVPKLLELNPSLYKTVLRMIKNNIADDEFLRSEALSLVDSSRRAGGFSVNTLLVAPTPIRMRAISIITREVCGIILEDVHSLAVDKLITNGYGATVLPKKNVCEVRNGRLIFNPVYEEAFSTFSYDFIVGENETPLGKVCASLVAAEDFKKNHKNFKKHLKNTFDYDKINGKLFFRNRIFGDEICLSGRKCTKKLKKLFNESKLPTAVRSRVLMLCDDGGIVWLQGFGVAERVSISETTKQVLVIESEDL
ncbi:MAG: tRNA lysidine(34) synthetase TilS [Clostridia bacterium]|nr:tRNA lysidine(34) synthetase TilS [Clostridia bacterium]